MIHIRDYQPTDFEMLYALNQAWVPHLGTATRERFQHILQIAPKTRVAVTESGLIAGFIITMDQTTPYDSPNYLWFKSQYTSFMYVDRIAVNQDMHGQGVGRMLYKDIQAPLIACEVNLLPPNPDSMAFHSRLGFEQVGTLSSENETKKVALLVLKS